MMLQLTTKSELFLIAYKRIKAGKPFFYLRSQDENKNFYTIGKIKEDDIDQMIDFLNFIKKDLNRS